MTWVAALPPLNAFFNALSVVFILAGFFAVRSRKLALHRALMGGAFVSSCIFLGGYLVNLALAGHQRFVGHPGLRKVYLAILSSHTLLAVVALPLVLYTFYVALRDQRDRHRRVVRFTLPIWLYVSATGVVIYVFVHHLSTR
ncbi:MAG: DUF420 domain-containing protein [Deltaproteobacteria bacterium]|nr:DUF420 domain-containing protein [Deltaproteobacteria bacterium]